MPSPNAARHLNRIPPAIVETFSDEQKAAVVEALSVGSWGKHPINIRSTLRLPGGPFYFTLVAGKEGRSNSRQSEQRQTHPFLTAANVIFSLAFAIVWFVGMTTLGLGFLFAIGRITW